MTNKNYGREENNEGTRTKGRLLRVRPVFGLPVRGKVIQEIKRKRGEHFQERRSRMAGVPEHVHEIQAKNQTSQVLENVRQEPRGPAATRPGRHAEVRAEKQGE